MHRKQQPNVDHNVPSHTQLVNFNTRKNDMVLTLTAGDSIFRLFGVQHDSDDELLEVLL